MRLSISRGKNSATFYVIDSFYKDGKSSSRVIKRLGSEKELKEKLGDIDIEAWARKQVAEMNRKLQENKEPLVRVNLDPQSKMPRKRQLFNAGYLFLESIYRELKIDKICKTIGKRHRFKYDLDAILSRLVMARILYPDSKRKTLELAERFIEPPKFQLQHIYRALSVLAEHSDEIQEKLYKNSLALGPRKTQVLYYDCTNYFFEITKEDELRKYGMSKERRPNPIVQMGLFMDANGLPLAFQISPGNRNEQVTLRPLERKIIRDFGISEVIVCTDAGLNSHANRMFNNGFGRHYITTQSVPCLVGHLKEKALDPEGWRLPGSKKTYNIHEIDEDKYFNAVFYKELWMNEKDLSQRLLLSYSVKYKNRQRRLRGEQVDRAIKLIGKKHDKLKPVSKKDARRFIQSFHSTKEGELAEQASYGIDEAVISKEQRYDGLYAVCTNLDEHEASAADIVKANQRRWQIEECFRIMKSEFKARPVFLSREERIKAHFLTCFMALLIYRILEQRLGNRYTTQEIISQLQDMNLDLMHTAGVYKPCYEATDLTDDLHQLFGFETDFEALTPRQMKEILKKVKKG